MNYLVEMLTLLTGAYNRTDLQNAKKGRSLTTNIGKLFSLIAEGFELIHDNAERVRLWDDLENAEGAVLDRYGANFGVVRGAASDGLYRIMIRVKMIAQLSGGDDPTIIRAAGELLGVDYSDILLEDVFPAKKALYVDQTLLSQEWLELIEQIAAAIKRILAAGVGLRLYLRIRREFRSDLIISNGATVGAGFDFVPYAEDRTGRETFLVSYSGVVGPTLSGAPADVKRPVSGQQGGAGGVFCHTHITSKLIE